MSDDFSRPEGEPGTISTALTALGSLTGDLSTHRGKTKAGFAQAAKTWRAPREADFTAAGAGILAQLKNASAATETVADQLESYRQALASAQQEQLAQMRRKRSRVPIPLTSV